MLRNLLAKSSAVHCRLAITKRSYSAATSRQKRALNEKQLSGTGDGPTKVSAVTPPPPASSEGSGGGGSKIPILVGVLAVGGAGAAYAMDMIPGNESGRLSKTTQPEPEAPVVADDKSEPQKEEVSPSPEPSPKEEEKEAIVVETVVVEAVNEDGAKDGNRVLQISLPHGSKRSEPPSGTTEHPLGGNKVAMSPPKETGNAPSTDTALKELRDQLSKDTAEALKAAHQELAKLSSLDMSELDNMTPSQLKIRLVQMTKELEERTKWEAVRLKEFLAMKEKEVEDKYGILLKKQRLEMESQMDLKLKEQKNELTSHAEETIREKEKALQSIVDNSLKIQEEQFNEEKAAFEKKTEEAISAKYEELFGNSLAQAKEAMTKRMEQKVKQLEALTKKLSDLEFALQTSKDFQSGSVQAHRMSAAAISLIDKLESSKPAGAAVEALKSVSENNAVVTSALEALPSSVATSGVATLQELQTRFEEKVYRKCRQAALVPEGQTGLEGQVLGMVFASLKYPPGPDDAAPESQKDDSEYVLARARRNLQLGELEQAVEQMDKLTGQAAFTARDWVQQAKERVAVEKALKVIRMECALANESMGSGPGAGN